MPVNFLKVVLYKKKLKGKLSSLFQISAQVNINEENLTSYILHISAQEEPSPLMQALHVLSSTTKALLSVPLAGDVQLETMPQETCLTLLLLAFRSSVVTELFWQAF